MKRVFVYLIIAASAATIGAGAGFAGKKLFGPANVYLDDGDIDALKLDAAQIVKKIDSYNGTNDKVDTFTTGEILNYAMEKFRTCENCCSFTFGVAKTIVDQDIRACLIKNGNEYFEESISKSSMVSLANRMFQKGANSEISFYSADKGSISISSDGASGEYSQSEELKYSAEDYKKDYGKTLDEVFIYLISDQTILSSNVEKKEDGYIISVKLDPELSTYGYKNQMKNISGLNGLPSFENVDLTFSLNKDLRLKKLSIDENYTATKFSIDAQTHGLVDIYYYSDEYIKIPELNETVTYMKGE